MANPEVNYEDKRFAEVEADKQAALNEVDVTYGNMISEANKFYEDQINASNDLVDEQSKLQQEKTDFAIEQINQQKEQAKKDYVKEQAGAYADWQKQADPYGVNAEKMASQGMKGTGFAESSQVAMYTAYQQRVASARESLERANINFANGIREAQLQGNSALAEIHFQAFQQQLELSLQGFQYQNSLILEQADRKTAIDNEYYGRYQDVLQQINYEKSKNSSGGTYYPDYLPTIDKGFLEQINATGAAIRNAAARQDAIEKLNKTYSGIKNMFNK